ncbi:LrgA family protein [Pseudomonas syringae pv. aceris]|nr:LrgA family protein [Pseudomonas syringae pv. aceris]
MLAARTTAERWLPIIGQTLLLMVIWAAADRFARVAHLPFSGGILGLVVLVVLLMTGAVKPPMVEKGAELLLGNMLLYFIPLVVSVVQYTQLFEVEGLKLFAAIGIGFISVMVATGFTVEWACQITRKRTLYRLLEKRRARHLATSHAAQEIA